MLEASSAPYLKYSWQQAVLDALMELRPERLPLKVNAAQRAIAARLRNPNPPDLDEQLALQDASRSLQVLFPELCEPRAQFNAQNVKKDVA